ncbi:MAG TPA: aldo/keto reductase [Candidatus Hydrogenedentes bacterium]|nr:aldo/keto reductase [Candidatus Hydrogenedentota bacterium]
MDRRTFMKLSAVGAAGIMASAGAETGAAAPPSARRVLGRTGLNVSTIGIGTFRTTEPAVIRVAFDYGVNYLDTARNYHNGRNEEYVGEAIKGMRDKVYIATKVVLDTKDKMMAEVETSLAKLGTDYVDVLMLHHIDSPDQVMSEDGRGFLAEARKQGKTRFVGISTHKNEVEVIDAMLAEPEKLFDVVTVVYNFKSVEPITDAIARAVEGGLGVVAMKTQAGGYETKELGDISPHQAALKWVIQNPNVHTAIPSMVNLDQIKEDTAVMQMEPKLSKRDREVLERYAAAIAPYYCLRCGRCEGTCPEGVDIQTVNRCMMYMEGYRDPGNARAAYAELAPEASLAQCRQCGVCKAQCANGLVLSERLARARHIFEQA